MDSRNSAGIERKIEHRLFLLSVWSKGIAGLAETIGGLLLLGVPQAGLNALVIALTAPELAEDPTDRVASKPSSASRSRACGRYETIRQRLSSRARSHQAFPGRGAIAGKVVGVSAVALVPCRVHRLPVLSFHLHAFDLARAVDGFGFDRGVLDLARISVALGKGRLSDYCSPGSS